MFLDTSGYWFTSGLNINMILSFIGNHIFAVVRGAENYDTIKSSFRDVLRDINRLIERGFILVGGHLVPVEIFLGRNTK